MLRGALVRVQARESRRPGADGDGLRQRHRRFARKHAAALRADVDLDVDVERAAGLRRRRRQVGDHARIVDQHAHGGGLRERGEARDLRGRDDLVGHEHVGDSRRDERGRLVHFLAADADRAARDLRLRDVRALVRLGVRTQARARSREWRWP